MILIPMIIAVWAAYRFYRKSQPPLSGWRRNLLFALRSVSFLLIIIFLFNPILTFIQKKTNFPKIILLSDVSESMNQTGSKQSKAEAFERFRQQIGKEYSQENYLVSDFDFADGLQGNANNTQLSRTLQELAKRGDLSDVQEIFLFSDGWLKDDNLAILEDFAIPLNVVLPEFEFSDFDLEITDLRYNRTVYRDETAPLQVLVKGTNFSGKAEIDLRMDDKVLQSQKLDFSKTSFQEIYFEHIFKNPGLQNFAVTIHSDSTNEQNIANNTFPAAVQVLENRLKCVLTADRLTWDESFIMAALRADPYWETVFLLKQNQFQKADIPVNLASELLDAHVLILANHHNLKLARQDVDLIIRFVSAGGSLITMGKLHEELSLLLPASSSSLKQQFNAQLRFTEESRKYQTFRLASDNIAAEIPPVDYFYVVPKVQAEILAVFNNEQNSPAMLYHSFEKGKVMHFALQNLWKWQLRSSEGHYNKFINDLINWLGRKPSDRLIVQTDKNSYFAGETVKVSAVAYDEKLLPMTDLNAKLVLFDDRNSEILSEYLLAGDQEFQVNLTALDAGKYHYRVADEVSGLSARGEFSVSDANPESRDSGINYALLSFIADKTSGKIITSPSLEDLTISPAEAIRRDMKREIQLYRKWYLIAGFLLSFCLELFFRKSWGML